MELRTIDISWSTILKVTLVVLGIIFIYAVRDVAAIFFLALIIASAVGHWAEILTRIKIPRLAGVLGIYIIALLLITLIVYLVIPLFINQIQSLALQATGLLSQIEKNIPLPDWGWLEKNFANLFDVVGSGLGLTAAPLSVLLKIFGGGFAVVFMFVISFYLSLQENGIEKLLRVIIPRQYEEFTINIWRRSQRQLGRWFQSQLALSIIVGLLAYVGLLILGVPYALVLAVLVGVFEIFPLVGPVLAAIPAVILGTLQSLTTGIWIIILYVIIHQIENHVIVPNIMKKTLGLNPVIVIVAVLVGAKLAGIVGILLAVPLVTVAMEILNEVEKKRTT